jgi:hypothetical protein
MVDDTRDLYEAMWRQTEAESRRMFPELFSFPEEREVVPLQEAARIMRRSTAEVRRLAEMRFLYARREDGVLKVEPAILN